MNQIRYKVDIYEVNLDTGNHPQARGITGYAVGWTNEPIIKIKNAVQKKQKKTLINHHT